MIKAENNMTDIKQKALALVCEVLTERLAELTERLAELTESRDIWKAEAMENLARPNLTPEEGAQAFADWIASLPPEVLADD